MIKKLVAVLLIVIAASIYFYYHPISVNADFALNGSIHSAEGEILEPCSIKFDGEEAYFLFGNQPNALKGTLRLTGRSMSVSSYVYLEISSALSVEGKSFSLASGMRYRGKALGAVTCDIYYSDDRSICIVVDNGHFYCVSSLSESETRRIFDQLSKIPRPAQ